VRVSNWKGSGKQARINAADYLPERDGEIIEGPTQPPPSLSVPDVPLKNPHIDEHGRRIADQHSPLHRA
jgi:hypothetical protein